MTDSKKQRTAYVGEMDAMLAKIAEDCKSDDPNIASTARLNMVLVQDFYAWLREEQDRGTPAAAVIHATVAGIMSCAGGALMTVPQEIRPEIAVLMGDLIAEKWELAQTVTAALPMNDRTEESYYVQTKH